MNEPTSRSGGKATAVQKIRKVSPVAFHLMLFSDNTCKADYILVHQVHGYKALVMIGDGATDLEVCKFNETSKL